MEKPQQTATETTETERCPEDQKQPEATTETGEAQFRIKTRTNLRGGLWCIQMCSM
jgi:hypothetical protein